MKNIANETRITVFKVCKMIYPKQQYADKILGTKICKIWKHHPERQFGCLEEQIANFERKKWSTMTICKKLCGTTFYKKKVGWEEKLTKMCKKDS